VVHNFELEVVVVKSEHVTCCHMIFSFLCSNGLWVASNTTPAKCRSHDRPNIGQSSLQFCMAVWCSSYTVLFLYMLLMSVFGLRGFESCGKWYFLNLLVLFHLPPPIPYIYCYFSIIIPGWLSYSDVKVSFSLTHSEGCFGRGLVSGWFKGWSEL